MNTTEHASAEDFVAWESVERKKNQIVPTKKELTLRAPCPTRRNPLTDGEMGASWALWNRVSWTWKIHSWDLGYREWRQGFPPAAILLII